MPLGLALALPSFTSPGAAHIPSINERVRLWNEVTTPRAKIATGPTAAVVPDENAQARLHALVRANTMLAVTPDIRGEPATPSPRSMPPPETPPTVAAHRIAEEGIAAAEALESSGQVSDREVASMKAAALEEAAHTYRRLHDTHRDDATTARSVRPTSARGAPTPMDQADLATTARLLDYWFVHSTSIPRPEPPPSIPVRAARRSYSPAWSTHRISPRQGSEDGEPPRDGSRARHQARRGVMEGLLPADGQPRQHHRRAAGP